MRGERDGGAGAYLWVSPLGYLYLVGLSGTYPVEDIRLAS